MGRKEGIVQVLQDSKVGIVCVCVILQNTHAADPSLLTWACTVKETTPDEIC